MFIQPGCVVADGKAQVGICNGYGGTSEDSDMHRPYAKASNNANVYDQGPCRFFFWEIYQQASRFLSRKHERIQV